MQLVHSDTKGHISAQQRPIVLEWIQEEEENDWSHLIVKNKMVKLKQENCKFFSI